MTNEDVHAANAELKAAIVQVLWDFGDKYFGEKKDAPQAIAIVQAVLCETLSESEYSLGRMAPFTRKQVDHICYQIGDWYLSMKPLLEGQHNLGFMKERLKTMICGD